MNKISYSISEEQFSFLHLEKRKADDEDTFVNCRLVIIYLFGFGVKMDSQEAIKWLALAAKKQQIDSEEILGRIYMQGNGKKKL